MVQVEAQGTESARDDGVPQEVSQIRLKLVPVQGDASPRSTQPTRDESSLPACRAGVPPVDGSGQEKRIHTPS